MDIVVTVTADKHYGATTKSAQHAILNRSWRNVITPDSSRDAHRSPRTTHASTTTMHAPSMGSMTTNSRKRGVSDGRAGEGPMDLQEVETAADPNMNRRRCKTRSEDGTRSNGGTGGGTEYLKGARK